MCKQHKGDRPLKNNNSKPEFPFWLFVPNDYTPNRLRWCRPLGVFHPTRLRWKALEALVSAGQTKKMIVAFTHMDDVHGPNQTQQHQGNVAENTEMSACHFLHGDCMDLGHPSRLPDGSLRSAWTGPGRDPNEFTHTRKWQALSWRRWCASRWSAPNILSITNKMKFIY